MENEQEMNETDEKVLSALKIQIGGKTRGYMVKSLGIPRTTLYDSLVRLSLKNLVIKYSRRNGPGRPKIFYALK